MEDRSDEDIKNHIERIREAANRYFVKTEVEFVDNLDCDFDPDRCVDLKHPRIGYLAEAVKKLAYCDGVIFGNRYMLSRGCCVEYSVVEEYGLQVYYEDTDGDIWTEVW
jgi:hypothetical protein